MKLTFYWPGGDTAQDNEFIVSDYSFTQCYYNELFPADNYANVSIPWDTETANKLRLLKDDDIKAVISNDDGTPVFTGYIDSGIDFTKTQALKPISLKLTSPSFLLRRTVGETFAVKNNAVRSIVVQLLARLNIVYNNFDLPAVIPIVKIEEDEEYYDIIEALLFEYGCVFDFDAAGKFTVLPVFNQPPAVITGVFNGGNIRRMIQETCNKREYDYFRVSYKTVKINPNDLVYEDAAEKEVPAGLYFGHESETGQAQIVDNGAVYCEYASSKGELIWADVDPANFIVNTSGGFIIEKTGAVTGGVQTLLGNTGTSFAFRAKNNTQYSSKIREIKAVGTSYTGTTCVEVSKSGSLLKEYEARFLQDQSNAVSFTKNLANYYRYSSIKLNLESYADFQYGTFVTVSEDGIGRITARIVKKIYQIHGPISYALESVTDFEPAVITGEKSYAYGDPNQSSKGPDVEPPSPPSNLTLELRDDGKVAGSFTKSPDDDVYSYTVYRKTPDTPYKTVLTLDSSVNSFVDESVINGMEYAYRVFAVDNSGNASNPGNEAKIGTVTIGRPDPPVSASAEAYEEYIAVAVVPPTLTQDNRDVYAPVEYKIQISRDSGASYSDITVTGGPGCDYYFDRAVDGYPEISGLKKYRFKVFGVNIYGNLSTAVVAPVSTGAYLTWTPETPKNFRGASTGRTLYLEWDKQSQIFGAIAYRIQISVDGTTWYKPNVSRDPCASEDNYRENDAEDGFLEITGSSFYQAVPLAGQNTVLEGGGYAVSPRTYYYRVQAVNAVSGKVSAWSNGVELEAKGTGAQDMLNNSVGWDAVADKSILFEKLGAKNFIGEKSILALIANDADLSDKARKGFQYWALDNITAGGVQYKKGEFRINADTGDFFIVDPVDGISLKAGKIDIDALGANVYGNFSVFDKIGGGGLKQLFLDLVDAATGAVKASPVVTLGNNSRKPAIDLYSAAVRLLAGALNVGTPGGSYIGIKGDMIEFYQGGVMKAQIKLAAVAGVLSLLVSGLPLACEGITSSGDIKRTDILTDPAWTAVSNTTFGGRTINGIAYGGGKFVAVGDGGKAAYSTNGVSWTAVGDMRVGTGDICGIAYGNGKFVSGSYTGGHLIYSIDGGVSWNIGNINGNTFGIIALVHGGASGSEKFVAVGYNSGIAYSSDGVNWDTINNIGFGDDGVLGIAYGGGKFVVVGGSGKASYGIPVMAKLAFKADGTVGWVKG